MVGFMVLRAFVVIVRTGDTRSNSDSVIATTRITKNKANYHNNLTPIAMIMIDYSSNIHNNTKLKYNTHRIQTLFIITIIKNERAGLGLP